MEEVHLFLQVWPGLNMEAILITRYVESNNRRLSAIIHMFNFAHSGRENKTTAAT